MNPGPKNISGLAARVRGAALLEGDFVLSGGQRSRYYVDKYLFSTEPGLLRDVAAGLVGLFSGEGSSGEPDRLAGVELGAVPLVVAASLHTGLPYVVVRKAAKDYGTGRGIEGAYRPGERVVLLEDVVTTGAQAVGAARGLVGEGLEVVKVVAVLDRREARTASLEEFPFEALLRMEDLRVGIGD